MPADIILYGLIAAGLVLWLRNILGTRHGGERQRPNPFSTPTETSGAADARKAQAPFLKDGAAAEKPALAGEALPPRFAVAGQDVQNGLAEISRHDRAFNLLSFLEKAQDAFVIVVEAFAKGERETLKDLLSDGVYAAFDSALRDREARGEKITTEIHAIRKAEVVGARMQDRMAFLMIRFTADETCVIRDAGGAITAGNPDRVTEMVDIWTFGRDVRSRNPVWHLYETREGDVVEDHKTPVPDTSMRA